MLLPPLTAPIPSGWNVPACRGGGGESHPLKHNAFSRRTEICFSRMFTAAAGGGGGFRCLYFKGLKQRGREPIGSG